MRTILIFAAVAFFLFLFPNTGYLDDEKSDFDKLTQFELNEHLCKAINRKDGQYLDKYSIQLDLFDSKSVYKISKADEDYIYLDRGKDSKKIKWEKIKPWVMCEIFWLIHNITAGEYWAMAEYAFDNQLEIQASEFLGEMCRLWRTLRIRAEKYIAKRLGLEVPKAGYKFLDLRPKRCRLVTPDQLKGIENEDKIKKKITEFSKSLKSYAKTRPGEKKDELLSSIRTTVKEIIDLFADAEKFEMLHILIENFKYAVKKLKQLKTDNYKEKWEQLEIARVEALRRIYDTKKYPDRIENAPEDGGQNWVNEAVSNVKSIWVNEELGRIGTQLETLANTYVSLFKQIDKTQKYYKEFEFKHELNLVAVKKIDKTIFKIEGLEETAEDLATRLYQEVNYYRELMGLEKLEITKKLAEIAKGHAIYMKRLRILESKIPDNPLGDTLTDRLEKIDYKFENATDFISDKAEPLEILRDWQNNPAYHRALLSKTYGNYGIGFVEKYCCMVFTDR